MAAAAEGRAFGLLDAFRSEVRSSGDDSGSRSSSSSKSSGYTNSYNDPATEEAKGKLFLCAVLAPFYVPHVMLDDDFGVEAWYQRYPYDIDFGHLVVGDPEAAHGKFLAARVSADYGSNLDDVSWISGKLLISGPLRLGLDAQFTDYQERLGRWTDNLWVGDCNLVYRFAQSNCVEFRAGVGFNWLADHCGDQYGVNVTYGWDVTAVKPFVWSTEFDLGTLGSAFLFHGRTTVGVVFRHVEAFVGGDLLSANSAHIGGLLAGVRLWF